MAQVTVGTRLRSSVCDTEVMVVAAPDREVEITCGGAPMVGMDAEPAAGAVLSADAAGGTQIGKRYTNDATDIELLCTKPGEGTVAVDGELLELKEAKPLPSSD